jgi:hypothetical protein
MMPTHGVAVFYFIHDAQTAVSQPPLLGLSHDAQNTVSGGLEAYPTCSMTYMSLHLSMLACGSFNWLGTRRELTQPITFEEV